MLAIGMGLDMYIRLQSKLNTTADAPRTKAAAVHIENQKDK